MQSVPHLEALRLRARALPEAPGVYFWKDSRDRTLYIGKAVNLRSRVTSYFSTARHDRRTRELIMRARSIDFEVTATELEALFRESALIKREQPALNRALRRSVPGFYLKFAASLPDPYLETTRVEEDDGSLYFGPFRSAGIMRETVEYLHAVLPLRKCTALKPRCRPCIYHQMQRCAAPLIDAEHRSRHQEAITQVFDLLDGRSDRVVAWLEQKRNRLSEALLFERAAEVQQRLDLLHELVKKQHILDAAVQCRCVLIYQGPTDRVEARLLLVAHGSVVAYRCAEDVRAEQIVAWIRAHAPIVRAAADQDRDLDAARVLERWLTVNRRNVRWSAIPVHTEEAELEDRVRYVLGL